MCHARTLIWVVLASLFAGCTTGKGLQALAWPQKKQPFEAPNGADVLQMDVALVERPIDDTYVCGELWRLADEQMMPLDRKAVLDENGFRVGVIGGSMPARLHTMLTSKQSCANPRHFFIRAGKPERLTLGPVMSTCRFQIRHDEESQLSELLQATCNLSVQASTTANGQMRLQFTPEIEYGETRYQPRVAEDESGLLLAAERPTKSFPSLSWEVTLVPNQYLVIGPRADRLETLGHTSFIRYAETIPVQRLLVIRTYPGQAARTLELTPDSEEEAAANRITPLAVQASWTTARLGTAD